MGVPDWDPVQGVYLLLERGASEGSTVDLPPHRAGLGSSLASCCLAVRQSPLSLRVTAPMPCLYSSPLQGCPWPLLLSRCLCHLG